MTFILFVVMLVALTFALRSLRTTQWYLGLWIPTVFFLIFSSGLALYFWVERRPYEQICGVGASPALLYAVGILFIPCGLLLSFMGSPPSHANWKHAAVTRLFILLIPLYIAMGIVNWMFANRFIEGG
jgi:hypothetical protein